MSKPIILNWTGPYNVEDFSVAASDPIRTKDTYTDSDNTPPHQPGVYCFIYKPETYRKMGCYIGATKDLYWRCVQHYQHTLCGDYVIPKENPVDFHDYEYWPVKQLGQFANRDRLKRQIDHVFDTSYMSIRGHFFNRTFTYRDL